MTNIRPRDWGVALLGAGILPFLSLAALLATRSGQGHGYQRGDEVWLGLFAVMGAAFAWRLPVRPGIRLLLSLLLLPGTFVALLLIQQGFYCGASITCG